jgi:hypothetical protein
MKRFTLALALLFCTALCTPAMAKGDDNDIQ